MARYKISFEIELNDEAGHPKNWVPDAVFENLNDDENTLNWEFEELDDNSSSVHFVV